MNNIHICIPFKIKIIYVYSFIQYLNHKKKTCKPIEMGDKLFNENKGIWLLSIDLDNSPTWLLVKFELLINQQVIQLGKKV